LKQEQLKFEFNNLRLIFPLISEYGLQLFLQLLAYDPNKRLTAAAALCHEYFASTPLPQNLQLMPTFKSLHD
jgi:cell division cycle 2-like protein